MGGGGEDSKVDDSGEDTKVDEVRRIARWEVSRVTVGEWVNGPGEDSDKSILGNEVVDSQQEKTKIKLFSYQVCDSSFAVFVL